MKPLYLLLLVSFSALAGPRQPPKEPARPLDIWGTCYFYYNCEGNPIGLGKTASECRAQGGHSLFTPNVGRCYNI